MNEFLTEEIVWDKEEEIQIYNEIINNENKNNKYRKCKDSKRQGKERELGEEVNKKQKK